MAQSVQTRRVTTISQSTERQNGAPFP